MSRTVRAVTSRTVKVDVDGHAIYTAVHYFQYTHLKNEVHVLVRS